MVGERCCEISLFFFVNRILIHGLPKPQRVLRRLCLSGLSGAMRTSRWSFPDRIVERDANKGSYLVAPYDSILHKTGY